MKLSSVVVAVLLLAGFSVAVAADLEDTLQSLKQAAAQKNVAEVKKLAAQAHSLAAEMYNTPAPQSDEGKEAWNSRVAYAKSLDAQVDYLLYTTAVQLPPAQTVELMSQLEEQSPKSQYLDAGYGQYLVALTKTGSSAKAVAAAQKGIQNFPDNEDLLLLLADDAMNKKQNERALQYASRLTNVLEHQSKPEGMAAAAWEARRNAELGRGYWIAGLVHAQKNDYVPADKALRAALPLIQGNNAMMGPALFYLGVVNYQLGKMTMNKARVLQAVKFSEQSAAIPGPYSQPAWRNAIACRKEAAGMR